MPPSFEPSLPFIASSAFREASLTAAMIRSSSISTSPPFTASGSILSSTSSFKPFISPLTTPPPALALTRIRCISRCISSCICCACFIISCKSNPPGSFIPFASWSLQLFLRFYDLDYLTVKLVNQRPQIRVTVNQVFELVWFRHVVGYLRSAVYRSSKREPSPDNLLASVLYCDSFIASLDLLLIVAVLRRVGYTKVVSVNRNAAPIKGGDNERFVLVCKRTL